MTSPEPRDVLSALVGCADRMLVDQDKGRLRPSELRTVMLGQLYGEIKTLPESCGVDQAARLLCECLIYLDRDGPPLYDTARAAKWAAIARSFLPWVRTDFAALLDASAAVRPATTDQDYAPARGVHR